MKLVLDSYLGYGTQVGIGGVTGYRRNIPTLYIAPQGIIGDETSYRLNIPTWDMTPLVRIGGCNRL